MPNSTLKDGYHTKFYAKYILPNKKYLQILSLCSVSLQGIHSPTQSLTHSHLSWNPPCPQLGAGDGSDSDPALSAPGLVKGELIEGLGAQ